MTPAPRIDWPERWRRLWLRLLPSYWLFLFVVTHLPRLHLPDMVPQEDKIAHVIAYGLLALLLWKFAESVRRAPLGPRFVWVALAVLAGYAALDEYLQSFVGRTASVGDWLADMLGAALVLAAMELRRRALHRRGTASVRTG